MRLTDFRHTTSFRLGLLFLTLFALCSTILFGMVYWQTAGFMRSEQNAWLARESASVVQLSPADRAARLANHARLDQDHIRPFGEFLADGTRVAGDLLALPPELLATSGPTEFFLHEGKRRFRYLGQLSRLEDGRLLVVSQNVHEPHEFQEHLVSAMLTTGAIALALGLLGAATLGVASVRRIDEITRSIRRIVTGDLSQRLPVRRGADDLNRLAIAVNGMLDDIERLVQEVKGVCDGIAHDLRTPLTRILGGLERAQRRATRVEEFQAAIVEANQEIHDLLRTFNAMLRISEVEAGARRLGFVDVDLRKIANDVIEFYLPLAEERGLALSIVDNPAHVTMPGDPSLLFDAIGNLVDNAVKFTPAGGTITISVDATAGARSIVVSDDGPGIPPDEHASVITRFYRGEPSRTAPGNGLGLSLVAVTARLHDMAMTLGTPTHGTGLVVRLASRAEPA
jgi:signal transduction histidine kinase